jgi:hypothetical protein
VVRTRTIARRPEHETGPTARCLVLTAVDIDQSRSDVGNEFLKERDHHNG